MGNIHIGWFIGLAGSAILMFVAYFICSSLNYKKRFQSVYDFKNHFPYEFNYESKFSDNILGNVALIFMAALSIGFFAIGFSYFKNNGYVLVAIISGVLYSILAALINFIPLKTLKVHLAFSLLLLIFSFATPVAIGLTCFSSYQNSKEVFPLVVMIVSFVVALFLFALAMNPRLTPNFKMIVTTDEKGNETYVRPSVIVLALSEWITIFALLLNHILYILMILTLL